MLSFCVAPRSATLKESPTLSASPRGEAPLAVMRGKPTKRLRFAHEGTSTWLERKMRPRPRLRFWPTQRPCFRVSSSCTLYEVFGNFAWRSAPPRKRVTQLGKVPALRDRECPRPTGLSVDSLLHCNKGNGNGGNSVRKGVSFTTPSSGF